MFVTFMMIRLVPGDPIEVRRGERGISPERLAELRHEMGLDQPIWKQFLDYVWGLLHGDFGTSIISKTPVAARIPHAVSGHARTHHLRHDLRHRPGHSGRRHRRRAARRHL